MWISVADLFLTTLVWLWQYQLLQPSHTGNANKLQTSLRLSLLKALTADITDAILTEGSNCRNHWCYPNWRLTEDITDTILIEGYICRHHWCYRNGRLQLQTWPLTLSKLQGCHPKKAKNLDFSLHKRILVPPKYSNSKQIMFASLATNRTNTVQTTTVH